MRSLAVRGDHAVPGHEGPTGGGHFVEQAARVGEGRALGVEVEQRGADEDVAGGAGEEGVRVEGAAEAREAERGARLGEGREGGGVAAAQARGEERGVVPEAQGVGPGRGGELDQAVPVTEGGRRGRDAHAEAHRRGERFWLAI